MPPRRNNNIRSIGSVDISSAINHGSAKLKKKIRDISRLLKRDNLPSTVRIENERALKTLKMELDNTQENLKAKKLATRYHKIRFFERKKATRKYNQAKRDVEQSEMKQELESKKEQHDEITLKELKKEIKKQKKVLRHCEIDLVYVLNFPKTEKYIALYPSEETGEQVELTEKAKKGIKDTENKRFAYKKQFAELMDKSELEISIEDGLKGLRQTDVKVKNQRAIDDTDEPTAKGNVEDQDGDGDDDFFE